MDMWHTRTNYVNLVNSKNICLKPGEFGGVFPNTSFGWFPGPLFIWPSDSPQERKIADWKMPKKGQSSLGRFSQIGCKTRYELQIFKSPFRVLATHWKPNIEILLKLLFSSFLAIKNLRNRIISENLILISLFGEISQVIFLKKRATAGGFRRWWWPLNVHVIRFSRWVIDDDDNNNNNSHVSHDALSVVVKHSFVSPKPRRDW